MELLAYTIKKLLSSIPIFLGVTFLSFLLMVYFGNDVSYSLMGRNGTLADLEEIRRQLGYHVPFMDRYLDYLQDIFSLDFGRSIVSHEKISDIFRRSIPISIAVNLPGFVMGNLLAVVLSLYAVFHQGKTLDKVIMLVSGVGMSMSFLIVIIGFQLVFCSSYGLNWFPVQGWDMSSVSAYAKHVCIPTLATIFVSFGYNTRFFRAVMAEEMSKLYVRSAMCLGLPMRTVMVKGILWNALIPIVTRVIFSIPFLFMEGSLLLESFFGIPGMGGVTYSAIAAGDMPVLKLVVGLGSMLYLSILILADIVYKFIDPRISLS